MISVIQIKYEQSITLIIYILLNIYQYNHSEGISVILQLCRFVFVLLMQEHECSPQFMQALLHKRYFALTTTTESPWTEPWHQIQTGLLEFGTRVCHTHRVPSTLCKVSGWFNGWLQPCEPRCYKTCVNEHVVA